MSPVFCMKSFSLILTVASLLLLSVTRCLSDDIYLDMVNDSLLPLVCDKAKYSVDGFFKKLQEEKRTGGRLIMRVGEEVPIGKVITILRSLEESALFKVVLYMDHLDGKPMDGPENLHVILEQHPAAPENPHQRDRK